MFDQVKDKYAGSVSAYAEKDHGYRMSDDDIKTFDNPGFYQVTSEVGPRSNLNVTVCKNFGFNVTCLS